MIIAAGQRLRSLPQSSETTIPEGKMKKIIALFLIPALLLLPACSEKESADESVTTTESSADMTVSTSVSESETADTAHDNLRERVDEYLQSLSLIPTPFSSEQITHDSLGLWLHAQLSIIGSQKYSDSGEGDTAYRIPVAELDDLLYRYFGIENVDYSGEFGLSFAVADGMVELPEGAYGNMSDYKMREYDENSDGTADVLFDDVGWQGSYRATLLPNNLDTGWWLVSISEETAEEINADSVTEKELRDVLIAIAADGELRKYNYSFVTDGSPVEFALDEDGELIRLVSDDTTNGLRYYLVADTDLTTAKIKDVFSQYYAGELLEYYYENTELWFIQGEDGLYAFGGGTRGSAGGFDADTLKIAKHDGNHVYATINRHHESPEWDGTEEEIVFELVGYAWKLAVAERFEYVIAAGDFIGGLQQ
jgi:hypothetical protein